MHLHKANGPSTWWLEGATSGLGLKKSHSSIPLKAHGQGPASRYGQRALLYRWAKSMFQSTRTGPWIVLTGDGPPVYGWMWGSWDFLDLRENASS
jgi:hypothetical protein